MKECFLAPKTRVAVALVALVRGDEAFRQWEMHGDNAKTLADWKIKEARYTRFERLADRLGCGEDYVRRELEHRITR